MYIYIQYIFIYLSHIARSAFPTLLTTHLANKLFNAWVMFNMGESENGAWWLISKFGVPYFQTYPCEYREYIKLLSQTQSVGAIDGVTAWSWSMVIHQSSPQISHFCMINSPLLRNSWLPSGNSTYLWKITINHHKSSINGSCSITAWNYQTLFFTIQSPKTNLASYMIFTQCHQTCLGNPAPKWRFRWENHLVGGFNPPEKY